MNVSIRCETPEAEALLRRVLERDERRREDERTKERAARARERLATQDLSEIERRYKRAVGFY